MKFVIRFIIGTVFGIVSIILFYLGMEDHSPIFLYLGSFFIGMGTLFMYLSSLGLLKHFPKEYLSAYLSGDYGGGFVITVLYLVLAKFEISINNVGRFRLTNAQIVLFLNVFYLISLILYIFTLKTCESVFDQILRNQEAKREFLDSVNQVTDLHLAPDQDLEPKFISTILEACPNTKIGLDNFSGAFDYKA